MTAHRFPSVTSILKILDKPAVNTWRCNEIADCVLDNLASISARAHKESREDLHEWIVRAPYRQRKGGKRTAAALGSVVHDGCEQVALDRPSRVALDDEAWPFIARFIGWCDENQPKFEASESTVVGSPHGQDYAGTLDGILTLDGRRILYDLTTNRNTHDREGKPTSPYREKAIQVCAYAHADRVIPTRVRVSQQFSRRWYEITSEEIAISEPMPKIDEGWIIHLTPETCRVFPVNIGPEPFEEFMHLRAVFESQMSGLELIGRAL